MTARMNYVNLNDTRVPKLGLGTWQMSGTECRDAVRDALEQGYRHVDTAQMYENEREVGDGIADSAVPRDDIFLTTKLWWTNLAHDRCLESTEQSLERLGTGYVDLLLIHWPNPDVPLEETLAAMGMLKAAGKVAHIGVSNFPPSLLEDAAALTDLCCNQVEYHPFLGQDRMLEHLRQRRMFLTAYSPLAQGRVTEDPTLEDVASAHGMTPAQVALRWLVQQDDVVAIPKAASAEHRRRNLAVFDQPLTDDEMNRISALARGERLVDPEFAPDWEC